MAEAADLAERVSFGCFLLKAANQHHLIEHVEKRLAFKSFDGSVLMLPALSMLGAQFVRIDHICNFALGGDACACLFGSSPARLQRFNFQFTHLGTLTDA